MLPESCWYCPHTEVASSGREPWVSNWYVCGKHPQRLPAPDPREGRPEWCPLEGEDDEVAP